MSILGRALEEKGYIVNYLIDQLGSNLDHLVKVKHPQARIHQLEVTQSKFRFSWIRSWKILINTRFSTLQIMSVFRNIAVQQALFDQARTMLNATNADLLIVCEDGISGNLPLISAAIKQKIPVLDCPYGYGTSRDLEKDLSNKISQGTAKMAVGPLGEEVTKKYPHWVKKGNNAGAIMYVPEFILAREELGITLRDAWIIHGGLSDILAVESQAMFDHYLSEGIPKEKLVLTGAMYADVLNDSIESAPFLKRAFKTGRKINTGRTSILVSWPPSYHATNGSLCEWNTYEDLTRTIFAHLAALKNVDVTLSLHPATEDGARQIALDAGLNISTEFVVELIPKHDVYLTCFSSTIRWAIAAAKPVVNYDFYGFDLPDYDTCPGVITIRDFKEYSRICEKLTSDQNYYKSVFSKQKKVADNWGITDGRNFHRIHEVVQSLLDHKFR